MKDSENNSAIIISINTSSTDRHDGGELYVQSRGQGKGKRCHKHSNNKTNLGKVLIESALKSVFDVVDEKSYIGGRESDTVIRIGHDGVLVTIVERAT